ncbi:mitochondrial phosphate carrier protein [Tribonema minus]|uniref:Mitochondrial phosphate carrier protein n=1 Tax=Tribonema minus TaxID=303371 RepID=A0A835Z0V7_9STRA|nr:mitochondrial phosphate carrier protein [Tribonema minus]
MVRLVSGLAVLCLGQLCCIASAKVVQPKASVKKVQPAVPSQTARESFVTGLLSGAVAGTTVDLILFPLDTVKTRLQTKGAGAAGLGIFKGLFNGVAPAIAASAPCAAVFFGAYDGLKRALGNAAPAHLAPFVHCAAAAGADLTQSVVRAPFEVVKQRMQAGIELGSARNIVSGIAKSEGLKGFYRGWGALALRDLPFDIIEFPMYEYFKKEWARIKGAPLAPWQGSLCGSVAGGIAAALTTPLDVVKTRLMTQTLGSGTQYLNVMDCLKQVVREEGVGALWAGVVPRMTSIAFGGAIFFGAYEYAKAALLARHIANKRAAAAASA